MIVRIPYYILRKYLDLFTDKAYNFRKMYRIRVNELYDLGENAYDHPQNKYYKYRERTQITPLFQPDRSRSDEFRPVSVIAPGQFQFESETGSGDIQFPISTRVGNVRRSRSIHDRTPRVITFRPDKPWTHSRRAEFHRRRKDKKIGKMYRRALRFVNRTYGTYSELAEIAEAFHYNQDVPEILTALAINESVDKAYGERARFLRDNIYSRSWYRLPVGIDFIQSRWSEATGGQGREFENYRFPDY